MSIIKDHKLTATGQQKIAWVKDFMPALTQIGAELKEKRAFDGLKIGMSIHMEAKTAYLATILRDAGAKVFATGCNPLSTQDDVAAGLAAEKDIEVYAIHGVSDVDYFNHLSKVIEKHPDLIIDDGGDLLETYCTLGDHVHTIIGGCEETTTGVLRLKQRERRSELPFPMMDINDAKCKHYYDNKYGTGQSVWDAIMHTTNTLVAGKNVVVAGYGYCGRGIALRARGMGANVIITEVDPVKAIEANLDGFRVMTMSAAARIGDFIITATGCKDVITDPHFRVMRDNVFLANAGHFNVEINLSDLNKIAKSVEERREGITGYKLKDDRTLNMLAEGRLVNLAAGNGHPAEIMDMSFSLQTLGLQYLIHNFEVLDNKVYDIPDEIDQYVAHTKLATMGIQIDHLSPLQRHYLGLT